MDQARGWDRVEGEARRPLIASARTTITEAAEEQDASRGPHAAQAPHAEDSPTDRPNQRARSRRGTRRHARCASAAITRTVAVQVCQSIAWLMRQVPHASASR